MLLQIHPKINMVISIVFRADAVKNKGRLGGSVNGGGNVVTIGMECRGRWEQRWEVCIGYLLSPEDLITPHHLLRYHLRSGL